MERTSSPPPGDPDARPLTDRRVLVTGGSTGIGRAIVAELAGAGARILTFARHEAPLAEALAAAGLPESAGLTADAARADGVEAVFAALDERLGGIDVLVCNHGLGAGALGETDPDEWRYVMEANLIGYMACARAAIDRMSAAGRGGHIVMVSSVVADTPTAGQSVYAASKAGIDGLALALRQELAEQDIAVSVIAPGAVGADMQEGSREEQLARIARAEMIFAEDIAAATHWLLTRPDRMVVADLRIEPRRGAWPASGS